MELFSSVDERQQPERIYHQKQQAGWHTRKDVAGAYCTDWIINAPTVNAIMTPTITTLEACWVRRTTEVKMEIPSIAAINVAGAMM